MYALKTDDGTQYLEDYKDRVSLKLLSLLDGNEDLAVDLADEMIYVRYVPATPSSLKLGRARRGELVSCSRC